MNILTHATHRTITTPFLMLKNLSYTHVTIKDLIQFVMPWFFTFYFFTENIAKDTEIKHLKHLCDNNLKQITVIQTQLDSLLLNLDQISLNKSNTFSLSVENFALTQSHLLWGAFIIGGLFVFYGSVTLYPHLFSLKTVLPSSLYSIIQTYIPSFQTKESYHLIDNLCDVEWLINIYKNGDVELFIKTLHAKDFEKASDFLSKLYINVPEKVVSLTTDVFPFSDISSFM